SSARIRIGSDRNQIRYDMDRIACAAGWIASGSVQDRIGRVRDVRVSPEGKVYLLNDEYRGGIFRLDPL
ncbi:MAG: hypothetical protein QF385_11415, partial [SAR324 cluster bacterium]|nr:hypothetical protein [SAR324 cluster bacterium]